MGEKLRCPSCGGPLKVANKRIKELEDTLKEVANIMHHGGLLSKNENDVRKLLLPYWDSAECDRLQQE